MQALRKLERKIDVKLRSATISTATSHSRLIR
jgi:hypothetical protein